jgi:hypothetical protein
MRRADRQFALGALALTLTVPPALLALRFFSEERATLGTLAGWGVVLLVMVPSYVLLARGMSDSNAHAFVRGFMLGAMLRFAATIAAVVVFAKGVADPPLRSFLLAYFLGYMLLTAVELLVTVPRSRRAGEQVSA